MIIEEMSDELAKIGCSPSSARGPTRASTKSGRELLDSATT